MHILETMDEHNNRSWSASATIFVITNILFAYMGVHYLVSVLINPATNQNSTSTPVLNVTDDLNESIAIEKNIKIETPTKLTPPQPACPKIYQNTILDEILMDLYIENEMCRPEDVNNLRKHRIPRNLSKNSKQAEPRGTMVVYIAVALLLTSLLTAILELYKAKGYSASSKTKPPLTRKCSLADLTVLKHNRKELMRRDTMWEIPEGKDPSTLLGRKVSRPHLRLD